MFCRYDVAKAQLDIALRPFWRAWPSPTISRSGVATLVDRCADPPPTLIVLEATGGWSVR